MFTFNECGGCGGGGGGRIGKFSIFKSLATFFFRTINYYVTETSKSNEMIWIFNSFVVVVVVGLPNSTITRHHHHHMDGKKYTYTELRYVFILEF